MIAQIVQTLTKIQITWKLDDVLNELPRLGLKLLQTVGTRCTFQDEKQQNYSVYFREDHSIRSIEATLYVRSNVQTLSDSDYQELIYDYNRHFDEVLGKLNVTLGNGKHYSLHADRLFPHDRDSIRLTMWKLPNADLMLELKHEGREVPVRLVLTLAPAKP